MSEKEYMTYEEAAEFIGVKRSTLYSIVADRGIKTHKFKYDKKRYLATSDVKRVKEVRENPWLAGPDEKSDPVEQKSEPSAA